MTPRISPNVAWQVVDGEAIVVDLASGKTIGLNATGTFLWSRLDGTRDPEALAAALVVEFEVPNDVAASHTYEFLSDMKTRALIVDAAEASR
jgi:hypothetical protein